MKWAEGNKANEKEAFYDVHGGPAFKKRNAPYTFVQLSFHRTVQENSKLHKSIM